MQKDEKKPLRSRLSVPGHPVAFRKTSLDPGRGALIPGPDSIQRRADFLIECLRESSDAELKKFFVDLGDWVFSDEKILSIFTRNLLDLYFQEMNQRR